MPSKEFQDLAQFHQKFKMPENNHPTLLTRDLMDFRLNFLGEELSETIDAYDEGNLAKVADGLVDLVYVAIGTAELMGLPWEKLWNEVHGANMKKERAERAGDSKRGSTFDVIKPEGWMPPNLEKILSYYGQGKMKYDRGETVFRRNNPPFI